MTDKRQWSGYTGKIPMIAFFEASKGMDEIGYCSEDATSLA